MLYISECALHFHTPAAANVKRPSLQQTERIVVKLVWHNMTGVLPPNLPNFDT